MRCFLVAAGGAKSESRLNALADIAAKHHRADRPNRLTRTRPAEAAGSLRSSSTPIRIACRDSQRDWGTHRVATVQPHRWTFTVPTPAGEVHSTYQLWGDRLEFESDAVWDGGRSGVPVHRVEPARGAGVVSAAHVVLVACWRRRRHVGYSAYELMNLL